MSENDEPTREEVLAWLGREERYGSVRATQFARLCRAYLDRQGTAERAAEAARTVFHAWGDPGPERIRDEWVLMRDALRRHFRTLAAADQESPAASSR